MTQYALGFFAGGLSLLAPCVLPILPLVLASSLRSSKWGPVVAALGMTLSFTVFGVLTTAFGAVVDADVLQNLAAVLLLLVGLFLLIPKTWNPLSAVFHKVSNVGSHLQQNLRKKSLLSEFFGGSLLGMIWSPCTGPTLAIAIALASQTKDVAHASLVFFSFGLGAGLGLIALGLLVTRFRFIQSFLSKFGSILNIVAGLLSVAIAILILTGMEGDVQEFLLKISPAWLTKLTVAI